MAAYHSVSHRVHLRQLGSQRCGLRDRRTKEAAPRRVLPHHEASPVVAASAQPKQGWTGVVKLGGGGAGGKKKGGQAGRDQSTQFDTSPKVGPTPPESPPQARADPLWRQSVVQISALDGPQLDSTSSGVVVNARQGLVLTMAGAVHYAPWHPDKEACMVNVHLPGLGVTLTAHVMAVALDADLALLQLDMASRVVSHQEAGDGWDEQGEDAQQGRTSSQRSQSRTRHKGAGQGKAPSGLAAALHAVTWATTPPLRGDAVQVAGFTVPSSPSSAPEGARRPITDQGVTVAPLSLCVTKGVMCRQEVQLYSYSGRSLLAYQVDAPVNAGCWGGGLFDTSGRCLGVMLQRGPGQGWRERYCGGDGTQQGLQGGGVGASGGENVAYAVPASVISHFLADLKSNRGRYLGFPTLGFSCQSLLSPALSRSCHMPPGVTGIRVTGVDPRQPGWAALKPGDIVTHMDGHSVSLDGHVTHEVRDGGSKGGGSPPPPMAAQSTRPQQERHDQQPRHGQQQQEQQPEQQQQKQKPKQQRQQQQQEEEVCMSHVVASQQVGSDITLQVLREGKKISMQARLSAATPLIPLTPTVTHHASPLGPRVQYRDPAHAFLGPYAFVAVTAPMLHMLYGPHALSCDRLVTEPGRVMHAQPKGRPQEVHQQQQGQQHRHWGDAHVKRPGYVAWEETAGQDLDLILYDHVGHMSIMRHIADQSLAGMLQAPTQSLNSNKTVGHRPGTGYGTGMRGSDTIHSRSQVVAPSRIQTQTLRGGTTSRPGIRPVGSLLTSCHLAAAAAGAADGAHYEQRAEVVSELVALVGPAPAWAMKHMDTGQSKPPTIRAPIPYENGQGEANSRNSSSQVRDAVNLMSSASQAREEVGVILSGLPIPMLLVSMAGGRVLSCAHVGQMAERLAGQNVRLGFACGHVLHVQL